MTLLYRHFVNPSRGRGSTTIGGADNRLVTGECGGAGVWGSGADRKKGTGEEAGPP